MKKKKGSLHNFSGNFVLKNLRIFSSLRGELFLEVCICVFLHFYRLSDASSSTLFILHSQVCVGGSCIDADFLSLDVLCSVSGKCSNGVCWDANRRRLSNDIWLSWGSDRRLRASHSSTLASMAAAAAAAAAISLNIPEQQMIRYLPGDANRMFYHHLVLFHWLEGSRWAIANPDHEGEEDTTRC